MSQAGAATSASGGVIPPEVALQYNTDINSPAVAVANVLNVFGFSYEDNNENGIFTNAIADTISIGLSNRIKGNTSTVGATTSTIVNFSSFFGGVGTYTFECRVSAYNITSSLSGGYSIIGVVRFDGVNANLVGSINKITIEEGAMSAADATFTVSGGSMLLSGVGYAAVTLNWSATGYYTFIGV